MWKECALPDTHLDGGAQYGGTLTQACCHGYHGTKVLDILLKPLPNPPENLAD